MSTCSFFLSVCGSTQEAAVSHSSNFKETSIMLLLHFKRPSKFTVQSCDRRRYFCGHSKQMRWHYIVYSLLYLICHHFMPSWIKINLPELWWRTTDNSSRALSIFGEYLWLQAHSCHMNWLLHTSKSSGLTHRFCAPWTNYKFLTLS